MASRSWRKTSNMVAVSNTSPVSNLSMIGRLSLLQSQFRLVLISMAVRNEWERVPDTAAIASIGHALEEGWLKVQPVVNIGFAVALGNDLDAGEAGAIVLATEVEADMILIDEKEGRNLARLTGLNVRGVLGILLRAKAMREIVSIKSEIAALRARARLFCGCLASCESGLKSEFRVFSYSAAPDLCEGDLPFSTP